MRAAKLPRVQFRPPEKVIGRRTETCMESGVFFSTVDAIDGMVERIEREWERPDALVVATGGYAELMAQFCSTVEEVDPFLTLKGLFFAGELLAGSADRWREPFGGIGCYSEVPASSRV